MSQNKETMSQNKETFRKIPDFKIALFWDKTVLSKQYILIVQTHIVV